MKVIIAGSRTITDEKILFKALEKSKFDITEVVSGMAKGADTLAVNHAICMDIPLKEFPANWNENGIYAGFARNLEMAKYADAAIILWDGVSRGSMHMKQCMEKLNKPVEVYQP